MIVFGSILLSKLNLICFSLLRLVSSKAIFIDPVSLSAYIIAFPLTFLAALPIVWINEPADLKKPSLSASSIATRDTSGKSSPSLSKLIPTSTSNSPNLKSLNISDRSTVSMSEWR